VTLIEWPGRAAAAIPARAWRVTLEIDPESLDRRGIRIAEGGA
jgi:tRNA A37 threonylcarbamoyladenosine biosynthesis protein TsaE